MLISNANQSFKFYCIQAAGVFSTLLGSWGALSDAQKQALVGAFVNPTYVPIALAAISFFSIWFARIVQQEGLTSDTTTTTTTGTTK